MNLKDAKEQCQVGDTIVTKQGYIGQVYIPRTLRIEIVRIENSSNSIKFYFDKNKTKDFAESQNRAPLSRSYVTVSLIDKLIKNPLNVKPTEEVFTDKILEHQIKIKKLLGDIEKEKGYILEVEGKIDFIKKFKLDHFDNKKYKAYKLIEEIKKISNGESTSDVIDVVAKLI